MGDEMYKHTLRAFRYVPNIFPNVSAKKQKIIKTFCVSLTFNASVFGPLHPYYEKPRISISLAMKDVAKQLFKFVVSVSTPPPTKNGSAPPPIRYPCFIPVIAMVPQLIKSSCLSFTSTAHLSRHIIANGITLYVTMYNCLIISGSHTFLAKLLPFVLNKKS